MKNEANIKPHEIFPKMHFPLEKDKPRQTFFLLFKFLFLFLSNLQAQYINSKS